MSETNTCPCGSGLPFENCCEPYLLGRSPAPTAEALMRARYSAYALGSIDYLYKTSGAKIRRDFDAEGSKRWSSSAEWTGLDVVSTEAGGADDEKGVVEFVAHYTVNETLFEHYDIANFAKVDGEWRFIDG